VSRCQLACVEGQATKPARPADPGGQMSERQASGAVKPSDSEAERYIYHQRSPPQRAVRDNNLF